MAKKLNKDILENLRFEYYGQVAAGSTEAPTFYDYLVNERGYPRQQLSAHGISREQPYMH